MKNPFSDIINKDKNKSLSKKFPKKEDSEKSKLFYDVQIKTLIQINMFMADNDIIQ